MGSQISRRKASNAMSLGELQSIMREVIVTRTSRQDMEDVWDSVLDMAKGQNQWAINVILERILGKAAVGSTATIADSAVSEELTKRLDDMTDEELQRAAELAAKIHGVPAIPHNGAEDGTETDRVIDSPSWGGPGNGVFPPDQVEEPGGPEEPG